MRLEVAFQAPASTEWTRADPSAVGGADREPTEKGDELQV